MVYPVMRLRFERGPPATVETLHPAHFALVMAGGPATRQTLGGNTRRRGTSYGAELKAVALVLLPAADPFGRRTVEPVLSFTHTVAVTGFIRHALHRLWLRSDSRRTSLPRIGAFCFCRTGI